MKTIRVSKSTVDIIAACAERRGSRMIEGEARPAGHGWYELDVDDDVAEALLQIDVDPNRAIQMVVAGQVGHS